MYLIKSLTLLVILSSFSLLTSGCALFVSQPEETFEGPLSKTFAAPYDEIWRAVQKSLTAYPIQTNNIELGIIETDLVKGKDRFVPPHKKNQALPNYKYQLSVKVIRGRIRGKESSRVSVEKIISLEKDFFSGEKKLLSDGFEEKVVLYRVERELQMDRSLRKAFETGVQQSTDDF